MKTLFIFSIALLLISCYRFVPVAPSQATDARSPEALISQLKLRKEYRFGLGDGSRIDMEVRQIANDSISGMTYGFNRNKKVSIQTKDIISIQRKKVAVARTVIAIVLPVTIVAFAIAIANDPIVN